jgi:type IV fimbrial biogenesis protein FimT
MRGFTMVELVVTMCIAAVLMALAAPSMSSYLGNRRVANASYDLQAALMNTRAEAVKRNSIVYMCAIDGSTWTSGWKIAFGVANCSSLADTNVTNQQDSYSTVTIVEKGSAASLSFGQDGRLTTGSSLKFQVDPAVSASGVSSRCVSLNPSGLPSTATGTCS